jgi:very-short-patch-repair endonuclease
MRNPRAPEEQIAIGPDEEIALIAARQGGVVSCGQLSAVGISRHAIHRRARVGRLHRVHGEVYAVGHPRISPVGWQWAAVLACGRGAMLSHWSAGSAWGLPALGGGARHHVIVTGRTGRARRPGITIHRPLYLDPSEVTDLDGLPITTPARTLLDLAAAGLRGRPLEAALDHAERRLEVDWSEVRRLLERHTGQRGASALAATLRRYVPGSVETFSALEEIVLELCDEFAIPRPRVNCVIEGKRRDFYWPHHRLVVEADSYAWHRSPSALNDDRERDVRLQLAGYLALRFTYEQCTRRRRYVRDAILQGLGAR